MDLNKRLGQVLYGALFTLVLPCLWTIWAWRLDHSGLSLWPIPLPPWIGVCLALAGLFLMVPSMALLWIVGGGLPMNAYPPSRLVKSGTYALLPHPIYAGFVCAVAGVAVAANSPAGLWIVAPISALSTIALVLGYEGPSLKARFGDALAQTTILGLPAADNARASFARRLSAVIVTLGVWGIVYSVFSMLPAPRGAQELRFAWELGIPTQAWAIWAYSAAYPIAIAAPFVLRTNMDLRRYVISAWLLSSAGFTMMLLFPGRVDLLPLDGDALAIALVQANRALDADWLALPSFHVAWVVLSAYCLRLRIPALAPIWSVAVGLVCISCVMTGSHAVSDVLVGLLLGVASWHYRVIWTRLIMLAEGLGNSWTAIKVGPVRIINHALYSGLAACAGIWVVLALEGPGLEAETAGVFLTGLLAAGAWGYWLEGGSRLARPFGYYGFLFGAVVALCLFALIDPVASQRSAAAFACGAPLAQAIGRFRCLVQGCCHGRPVVGAPGIRVINANSRVTALSCLHGVPIHPTQIYSIVGNLLIFAWLVRLWMAGSTATFVGGLYLILSSLARFVEEQYRGEPQTPRAGDMAIYQWLAIATFVCGILLSMVKGVPIQFEWSKSGGMGIAIGTGILASIFMSVDFPTSDRRFSRLTVGEAR